MHLQSLFSKFTIYFSPSVLLSGLCGSEEAAAAAAATVYTYSSVTAGCVEASAQAVRYRCWHFPAGEPQMAAAPRQIQAHLNV